MLPDQIRLTSMGEPFRELVNLTKTKGVEYGRIGFFDSPAPNSSSRFILGPISVGDDRSLRIDQRPPGSLLFPSNPVLLIHTHPSPEYASAIRDAAHFSSVDITCLMLQRSVFASVVLTREQVLLMHKSNSTPAYSEPELGLRQMGLMSEAKKLARRPGDAPRIYTKLAAINFGLSLFIGSLGREILLKKVVLQ